MRRLLFLFSLALSGAGVAADLPPIEKLDGDQPLFVELVLNGQPSGNIVPMTLRGADPIIAGSDLRAAGLVVNQDGPIDLQTLPGLKAHYDPADQMLQVDAPPALLPTHRIAAESPARAQTVASFGAMLNYDFYAQRGAGGTSVSFWTEQRIFGPFGTISNNGTLRWSSGLGGGAHGYLRYDTRYRYVDEVRALTTTVGDVITQSLLWTTSVRLGGLQIARDYRVRPDLVTMPLPSFAGQTAVPSAVDLFVDGYRQQGEATVAPGRFVLDSMPRVNGAGEATIVTTDAVGRQVSTTIPFYVSPELLRPGLFDVAGEIGFLRRGYGLKSFDYGALAVSGTIRRGLNDRITIEAHGEATRRLTLAGAGIVWMPGLWGTLNLSYAASHSQARTGTRLTAGYSYTARRFSIALQHSEQNSGYRDLGSFDLANYVGTRRSDRAIATVNFGRQGSLGLAYLDGRTLAGPRTRIASLSFSRQISHFVEIFITADHDLEQRSSSMQLRLVVPFGRNAISAGISHDPTRAVLAELDYTRSIPSQGGFGINANAASDQDGKAYGQGTATWRGRTVQLEAGAAVADGRSAEWVSATGSIVAMGHDWFAANQVSDAFAVVSTDGVADIPIEFENQPLGVTDRRGNLFVPSISAYHLSRFALDPLALQGDQQAPVVERYVALRAGSGATVRLPVYKVHSATIVLVDAGGKPLEPGGRVVRANASAGEIGWDGIVYLDNIDGEAKLDVTRRDGGTCHATISLPADAPMLAQIGPVPCR